MQLLLLLLLTCSLPFPNLQAGVAAAGESPFTPKSYILRYWKNHISNSLPLPDFLLSKASPLSTTDFASSSKLASDHSSLSTQLPQFCAKANLLCSSLEERDFFFSFATYANKNFANYSTNHPLALDSFQKYSQSGFTNYGHSSNVMNETFTNYGDKANGANDTFIEYGNDANDPQDDFRKYGTGGNAARESFESYRDHANVGGDDFMTYAKNSNRAEVGFEHYNNAFNTGLDQFKSYGKDATGVKVGFEGYGLVSVFKEYSKQGQGVTFSNYRDHPLSVDAMVGKGRTGNRKWVEPGKFFREEMLKSGTVMPMPDIRDKMPKRSFLPRVIVSKLPFSTSKLADMKKIFHAGDESSLEKMLTDALSECERAPSPGETKRCAASIEDMIDFATSILGRNVVVRTTEDTKGSKGDILIGEVKGINGGRVTKSVSCHQSLYPYLLYYCHSVPKVRVYEADILDPKSKSKINHGVAICHLDTSMWSAGHGAFLALGSSPGKIEVCHWIFENDMIWAIAD